MLPEAVPPLDDGVREYAELLGDVLDPAPLHAAEHHPGPVDQPLLSLPAGGEPLQACFLLFSAFYSRCNPWHDAASLLDDSIISWDWIIVYNITYLCNYTLALLWMLLKRIL